MMPAAKSYHPQSLLIFVFACLYACCAQAQELSFIHYNSNNSSLPNDVCYKLMQDRKGYLWAGTDNGLVRFDGRDMKIYRQGFANSFAIATAEYDSTFIIASWKGGVCRFENDKIISLRSLDPENTMNSNDILLYKDIVILYQFATPAFFRYNPVQHTLAPLSLFIQDTGNRVAPFSADSGLKFYIINDTLIACNTTSAYVLRNNTFYRLAGKGFDHIEQTADGHIYGLRFPYIYELSRDLMPVRCVLQITPDMNPQHYSICGFNVLASGNIVLQFSDTYNISSARQSGKFMFINSTTGSVTDVVQAMGIDVFISDVLPDHENGFWISTDGDGIYHVFEQANRQYQAFDNAFITAMLPDENNGLYIGTKNGVYYLSGESLRLVYQKFYVSHFFRDASHGIVVAAKRGTDMRITGSKCTRETRRYTCYVTPHYLVTDDQYNGFSVINNQAGKEEKNILRGRPWIIRDICEDHVGRIWEGGDNGLFYWDKGADSSRRYLHPVLGMARINQLQPDTSGGLWVATSLGLFYLRNNKVILIYNESNGLSNAHVTAVLIDKDRVWIGTKNGLDVLDFKTGNISVYKKYNGLTANDVTALAPFPGNKIAVGSGKGLTILSNREPGIQAQPPTLILERATVNDTAVTALAGISGAYRSRIMFTYNAISFIYPEQTRFQYRLSDSDQWIETQNKSIVLTNLEPGTYRFQLRARKYNSDWSRPLVVPLEIKKPWWQTTIFYLLVAGCIVWCIFFVFRAREMNMRKRALQRQQFSELKLKALQARLNPHFISNAFSAIQFFTLTHDEAAANDYLSRFAGLTRLLLEASHNRFIPLNDELQIVAYYLGIEQLRFKDRFEYTIDVDPGIDTAAEQVPGMLLQPFVENSINHGILYLPAGIKGCVRIHIRKINDRLEIEIRDNGIGRRKAAEIQQRTGRKHKSRGAEIMEGISQAVNDLPGCHIHTTITDVPGPEGIIAGTNVHITCLIHYKYTANYENSNY